jgi:hypothetical protein
LILRLQTPKFEVNRIEHAISLIRVAYGVRNRIVRQREPPSLFGRAGGLHTEHAVIFAGTSLSFMAIFDFATYRHVAVWYFVPVFVMYTTGSSAFGFVCAADVA